MTSTRFGLLFTVELLHKYFTDGACPDFTILPSAYTAEVLKGHKIIVKQYGHRLYAGTQLDKSGKPLIIPEQGMRLTFFLQLNNPLFFNYTNLPFYYPPGKIYYFTNRNTCTSSDRHFLSQSIGYQNVVPYKPGELATNPAHTVFQAVHTTSAAPPADDAASDDWMKVDKESYLTENDSLQWMPAVSTYTFAAEQPSATITVSGFNAAEPEKYSTVLISEVISFPKPAKTFKLDLSALPPGKYGLEVNGTKQQIYLNDELSRNKVFAVIDILQESTLAAGYELLLASGMPARPVYSIYFLNRATVWKYILPNGRNGIITDNATGPVHQFTGSPPANTIYSLLPIPLSENALDLKLTIDSHTYPSLPCAAPQRLAKDASVADVYCSEIFLNY